MGTAPIDSYSRYLSAKRTVDDRSLNRHVLDRLRIELAKVTNRPVRIVEIGGGTGTMVARLVELQIVQQAEYVLLDVDPRLLTEARSWLAGWADARRLTALDEGKSLRIAGEPGVDIVVHFATAELSAFLARPPRAQLADVLIANAFLDLVDVPALLSKLFTLLVPDGVYWFTVNFDGETIFLPEHPDDRALLHIYHRSMDERLRYGRRAGDSHCGRHLFGHLHAAGASILAAGASDWIVHPQDHAYPNSDAYFLTSIIDTIATELGRHPEANAGQLERWLSLRKQQIAHAELVYIAHQLDFVGRRNAVDSLNCTSSG
jgi:SAM-dependent methyltransferase